MFDEAASVVGKMWKKVMLDRVLTRTEHAVNPPESIESLLGQSGIETFRKLVRLDGYITTDGPSRVLIIPKIQKTPISTSVSNQVRHRQQTSPGHSP